MLQIAFLVAIGHAGVSQYLAAIPLLFAVAIWLLSVASCVLLNSVPLMVPKTDVKSVDAMGEISDVMLEKVESRSGSGVS